MRESRQTTSGLYKSFECLQRQQHEHLSLRLDTKSLNPLPRLSYLEPSK